VLLSYDRDQHEYYLPLDEITGEKGEELSSLDLQILELSFQFNDGSTSHAEIRFYVKGDLPSAEQIRLSQVVTPYPYTRTARETVLAEQTQGKDQGWVVLTEKYVNPTTRPLTYWFSADDVSYRLETELGMKLSFAPYESWLWPATDAGVEPDLRQVSRAALDQVELDLRWITQAGNPGNKKIIALKSGVRVPVRLSPGQVIEAQWRVRSSQGSTSCSDGAPASRKIWWCLVPNQNPRFLRAWQSECSHHILNSEDLESIPLEFKGQWVVTGYQIVGNMKAQVVVTEDGASVIESARKEGLELALSLAEDSVSKAPVNPLAQEPEYSCQGIF
jgi:hypothetical protein